jgi:acyl carrier protein
MKRKIFHQLKIIFQKYFYNTKIIITEKTSAKNIKQWDSLAQIGLIILIEKKFKIRFSINEVEKLKNIGDMADLIYEKNKKK